MQESCEEGPAIHLDLDSYADAGRLTAGKSDESVVPATSTNNDASEASAEPTEERGLNQEECRADRRIPDTEPGT